MTDTKKKAPFGAGRYAFGGFAAAVASCLIGSAAAAQDGSVDFILHNGKVVTQDPLKPQVEALAIDGGLIVASGTNSEILALASGGTESIDLEGRTVVPGLNDSHSHVVRAARFYNTELRWDGLTSLARGLEMVSEQAARTPEGQ